MKKIRNTFKRFHQMFRTGKFEDILMELSRLEKQYSLPTNILVLKGICISLALGEHPYSLEDAEAAFKASLSIDGKYVEGLLELGDFYLVVHDDAQKAVPYFRKALRIARSQMTEAVQGLAKSFAETRTLEEAIEFIERARNEPLSRRQINETIEYITALKSPSAEHELKLLGKDIKAVRRLRAELAKRGRRKTKK